MKNKPLRSSDIKTHNRNIVLTHLYKSKLQGVSQSELVEKTGLKAPTLYRIFSSLLENKLIIRGGQTAKPAERKKGRKPQTYILNPVARYILAAEFWAHSITMSLFNFTGDRVDSKTEALSADITIDQIVDIITDLVDSILKDNGVDKKRVLGLGIATPGQVNVKERKIVCYEKIKGMENYPLADIVEQRTELYVQLHNNCSALALGEFTYGGYDFDGSLFTYLLRTGVNGALVKEGIIGTSPNGLTMEAGHIPINFDGPVCSCGSRGCLQSYLFSLEDADNTRVPLFTSLEDSLKNNDEKARQTIEKVAKYLYISMKEIKSCLAPHSFLIITCSNTVSQAIITELEKIQAEDKAVFNKPDARFFGNSYQSLLAQKGMVDLVLREYIG